MQVVWLQSQCLLHMVTYGWWSFDLWFLVLLMEVPVRVDRPPCLQCSMAGPLEVFGHGMLVATESGSGYWWGFTNCPMINPAKLTFETYLTAYLFFFFPLTYKDGQHIFTLRTTKVVECIPHFVDSNWNFTPGVWSCVQGRWGLETSVVHKAFVPGKCHLSAGGPFQSVLYLFRRVAVTFSVPLIFFPF